MWSMAQTLALTHAFILYKFSKIKSFWSALVPNSKSINAIILHIFVIAEEGNHCLDTFSWETHSQNKIALSVDPGVR